MKDLKEIMEQYDVPCNVIKIEKKEKDWNPQLKQPIDCDYIDPAGYPHWDKD